MSPSAKTINMKVVFHSHANKIDHEVSTNGPSPGRQAVAKSLGLEQVSMELTNVVSRSLKIIILTRSI